MYREVSTSVKKMEFCTISLIFTALKMSSFVPNKHHLGAVLIFCFNWKKIAAEAHRMLVEIYGESAPFCREWFRRFS